MFLSQLRYKPLLSLLSHLKSILAMFIDRASAAGAAEVEDLDHVFELLVVREAFQQLAVGLEDAGGVVGFHQAFEGYFLQFVVTRTD